LTDATNLIRIIQDISQIFVVRLRAGPRIDAVRVVGITAKHHVWRFYEGVGREQNSVSKMPIGLDW
jgi:hypothetical protein